MKIAIINNLYPPQSIGGAEIYVERIIKELSRQHEVVLITSCPYKDLSSLKCSPAVENNIKIYRFYPFNIYHGLRAKSKPAIIRLIWHIFDTWNPHSYFVIRGILGTEKPDIVHTHNLSGFSLSAVTAAKSLKLPVVHTCHDFSLLCPYATLTCPIKKYRLCSSRPFFCSIYRKLKSAFIGNRPEKIIFPSKFAAESYAASGFFKGPKRKILCYCVDPAVTILPNRPVDYFNILYVGRLVRDKGVHILIDSFKKITLKNIKLHIVGKGDYAKQLKEFAGKDPRIVFYESVNNKDLARFYNLAQVTVVPSLWPEVLGIVILESFSSATPVIGSNIGGIKEVITDGYNGFLFKPGDTEELKNTLERLILEPGLLRDISKNAFGSSALFNTNEHCTRLLGIYKEALDINNRAG